MKITQRNLHIGAAIALVLYSVIYTAFVVHGNVFVTFFVVGLWALSSFSDQTRWLFYTFLIAQAWSNWHWIGLLVAIALVGYCITQNRAYRKTHPAFGRGRITFPGTEPPLVNFPNAKQQEQERRDAEKDDWRRQLIEEQRKEREQAAIEKRAEDAEWSKKLRNGDSDHSSW